MEILLVAVTGVLCIISFTAGAMVCRDKKIDTTKLNPVIVHNEHKEKIMAQKESLREMEEAIAKQEEYDKIIANLDRYDGTSAGQEDIR